jgi:hypothetical protein
MYWRMEVAANCDTARVTEKFPASRTMLEFTCIHYPLFALRDHTAFLRKICFEFSEVHPRMLRGFLIGFPGGE